MKELFPGFRPDPGLAGTLRGIFGTEPPRTSHAYTVEGSTAAGRSLFASAFASALLCENRGDPLLPLPCGTCRSCRNIASGINPDVITVSAGDGRSTIGIDAVRGIRSDIRLYPSEAERKIYIITDADRMTVQAQNAFLLTLEEPPSYAVLLLLCPDSRLLLETIRSRAPSLRIGAAPETGSEQSETLREAATRFAAVCRDTRLGREAMSLTAGDPGTVKDRETASALLAMIRSAFRDLAVIKKSPSAGLLFYEDRDEASKLADRYSVGRLLELIAAADSASDAIERSMNVRLALMKMLTDARMI